MNRLSNVFCMLFTREDDSISFGLFRRSSHWVEEISGMYNMSYYFCLLKLGEAEA